MRVLPPLPVDPQLLGVEVDRAEVEVDELLGAQAAARRRARAAPGRAARAACAAGMRSSSAASSSGRSTRGRCRGRLGDGDQVGGVLRRRRRARAARGTARAARRASCRLSRLMLQLFMVFTLKKVLEIPLLVGVIEGRHFQTWLRL